MPYLKVVIQLMAVYFLVKGIVEHAMILRLMTKENMPLLMVKVIYVTSVKPFMLTCLMVVVVTMIVLLKYCS